MKKTCVLLLLLCGLFSCIKKRKHPPVAFSVCIDSVGKASPGFAYPGDMYDFPSMRMINNDAEYYYDSVINYLLGDHPSENKGAAIYPMTGLSDQKYLELGNYVYKEN